MNILFVTPRLLYPLNRGDKVRPYYFARVLAAKHRLFLVSFIQSEEERSYVHNLENIFERVEVVLLKPWRSKLNMLLHFLSPTPLEVFYWRSREMKETVRQVASEEQVDIVYIYIFRLAQYATGLKGVFKILDFGDSISLFLRRMLPFQKSYLKPIFFREWLSVRAYEPKVARSFDECWLISRVDKAAIPQLADDPRVFIVPNGVDRQYFTPQPHRNQSRDIIFVGYMGFAAIDAVAYFYRDILPLVKRESPTSKFYIVGANPPKEITKLAEDPSVLVTGYVDDLRPYYNRAAVLVAPMRFVAGMQNKILEAMAMGLPVVTTSLGNEGIDAVPGQEIFVDDEPEGFARSVVQLIKNEELRKTVGAKAREFVQQRFTWNKALERMNHIEVKIGPSSEKRENLTFKA